MVPGGQGVGTPIALPTPRLRERAEGPLTDERVQSGRRHSAMARSTSTATTPAPTAPMMAPTIVPMARSVLQSRRHPMSDQP